MSDGQDLHLADLEARARPATGRGRHGHELNLTLSVASPNSRAGRVMSTTNEAKLMLGIPGMAFAEPKKLKDPA